MRLVRDLEDSGTPRGLSGLLLATLRWVSLPAITVGLLISIMDLIGTWFGP